MVKVRRRPVDIARGFLLLAHPIPVTFHIIAVLLLAILAAWPRLNWSILVLLVAAHAAMQLAIAFSNDYCDRQVDALHKKDKPIPRGLVQPREALLMTVLLITLMFVLLLPLSRLALLLSLLYLMLGLAYNLGLKSTLWSGIVFALAIPLIPAYAFAAVGHITPFIFWCIPVAALLGVALNLANSLPDIEGDAASQKRTLAVVLGKQWTFILCLLCIGGGALLVSILTISHSVPAPGLVVWPTLIIVYGAILLMALFFRPGQSPNEQKLFFYLVVITCLVLAAGWIMGATLHASTTDTTGIFAGPLQCIASATF